MKNNTEKIQDALVYFVHCIANHKEYGQNFNYEEFAKEQFKVKGHGFVFFDATGFVESYLRGQSKLVQIKHKYLLLKDWEPPIPSGLDKIIQYDASKQYAVKAIANPGKLPRSFTAGVELDTFFANMVSFVKLPTPSKITSSQIRKRLNRMVQQGESRLLVLDTSDPDCMGANLGKWLAEIKALERQGKHLNVIVDSDEESSALIPENILSDLLTLTFKS